MITDLGEIAVSPMPTAADWEGYPDEAGAHPATNHPRFVARLLDEVGRRAFFNAPIPPRSIWDPQAGAGTTMREARKQWRATITGWDIEARWRDLWAADFAPVQDPEPRSVGLIVTSPVYPGNKDRGKGERQEGIQASVGSLAGTGWGKDLPPGHLGAAKDIAQWMALVRPVIRKCFDALASGGYLCWIVRDYVVKNCPAGFVDLNERLLEKAGLEMLGGYWRPLVANNNAQLRGVLWDGRRPDPAQGGLFGQPPPDPDMLVIDREWALVGRVPDFEAQQAAVPW